MFFVLIDRIANEWSVIYEQKGALINSHIIVFIFMFYFKKMVTRLAFKQTKYQFKSDYNGEVITRGL